jgi:hypothetical protein
MSKIKIINQIISKLNLQHFGFEPYDINYKGGNAYFDREGNRTMFHSIRYINETLYSDVTLYFDFGICLGAEKFWFLNNIGPVILYRKMQAILYYSKFAPIEENRMNISLMFDVTGHPSYTSMIRDAFKDVMEINFRTPGGKIDEAQLDKAIAMINEVMNRVVMPFFETLSSIEKVNKEIIDIFENTNDISTYIPGHFGIKKLILMKLGMNPGYEIFKNEFKSRAENITDEVYKAKRIQLIDNILREFVKAETDPHYFDAPIPDDTHDEMKPNARHLAATQTTSQVPDPIISKPQPTGTRFNPLELEIITDAGMDAGALDIIHDYKIGPVLPSLSDSEGDAYPGLDIEGISYPMDIEGFDYLRDTINPQLQSAGYKAYITDWPDRQANHYTITVIPRGDDMDILRYQYTNGINHGLGPDEIINKLKTWRDLMNLSILGAGHDWVAFTVRPFPADIDGFISELIAFCPDYIQQDFYSPQGPDHSRQQIKDFIRRYGFVRLWWD